MSYRREEWGVPMIRGKVRPWSGVFWSTFVLAEENRTRRARCFNEEVQQGISAFQDVYEIFASSMFELSPSDAPLQTDFHPCHEYHIGSTDAGLQCAACHQTELRGLWCGRGPPGAPNWHLPERDAADL